MRHRTAPAGLTIGAISLSLLVITLLSYGLAGHGQLSMALFWLGMGGETNVGAWWSGMLFLLAAVLALELSGLEQRSAVERRGWRALAGAFALLSFDEIAQLHEYLSGYGTLYLAPLGALGIGLVAYAAAALHRARVPLRGLAFGFALLATVPAQELIQHALQWDNDWIYGLRAFVEEGTEVAAALIFIGVTGGSLRALGGRASFDSLVRHGSALLSVCAVALPLVAVAIYGAGFRGPGNWLGATTFLLCALVASQRSGAWLQAAVYALASIGANAVPVAWNPQLLGIEINLRALCFGLLLVAAPWLLAAGAPWRLRIGWLFVGVPTLIGAVVFPAPQLVWSMLPPAIALLCFYNELRAARSSQRVPEPRPPPTIPLGTVLADKQEAAGHP